MSSEDSYANFDIKAIDKGSQQISVDQAGEAANSPNNKAYHQYYYHNYHNAQDYKAFCPSHSYLEKISARFLTLSQTQC